MDAAPGTRKLGADSMTGSAGQQRVSPAFMGNFRIVIPPLTSETMNLIKNSSIALTIGLAELTFRAREMGEYTFNFFEAFSAATIIYIVIAMTANRVMAFVERRVAVPGYIAGGK